MDAETRALLIGLYKTLTKLTVTLVEQGAMDSNRAVRNFQDFAKKLGDEPHDQAARLWVDHLVETLEASRPTAKYLPGAVDPPLSPFRGDVPGREKYVRVVPAGTAATVTFSSDLPLGNRSPDYSKRRDERKGPTASGGHTL